jgi:hypothetical protein
MCCPADPCEEAPPPPPPPTPAPAPAATTPPAATPTPPGPPAAAPVSTGGQAQGQAPGSKTISKASLAADSATLRTMVTDHLLRTFNLGRGDTARLGRIGDSLGQVFAAGAFDDALPARMLRRTVGGDVRETVKREVVDSPTIRKLATELTQQHTTQLETVRRELQVESTRTSETMAAQNQELRAQLVTVQERLKKLEAVRAPTPPSPAPTPAADKPKK